MFNGNKRDRADRPALAPQAPGGRRGIFSVIGPDVVVTGNIVATADLHIDGRIEGDVRCASLAQGADSVIKGSVTAESARLAGTIEGSVHVTQLTVERTARITGDVEYEGITIEQGGHVDGRLKHLGTVAAPARGSGPRAVPDAGPNEAAA